MSVVAERVTVNPVTEDSSLVPLDLVGLDRHWGIYLLEHDYTPPALDTIHSSSADTEGDVVVQSRYLNRTITAKVRVFEPEDPASTNIATNPAGELATTGWAGVSLAAGPTRVVPSNVPPGLGIDTAIEAQTNAVADYLYHEVAVTNGKTYRFSVYVQLRAKVAALALQAVVYNAAGAVKKATGATKVEEVNTEVGGWVRIDVAFTADATATWRVGVEQTAGTLAIFYSTAVLVEESATLGAYFDGDTPGCDWTAARAGSTSTRPAPDGTRFSRICRDVTRMMDGIKSRKAGTLRRISAEGGPLVYDLRTGQFTDAPQTLDIGRKRAEYTMAFEALPGGRGPEIQIGGNFEEVTKPALTFLAEGIPGELPALGRLLIEDRQAQNQVAVYLGLQRDTYSSSVDAELFYEAETRKLLGTSEVAVLTGSSGAETKAVKSGSLVNAWQGVVSTQAASGNHLTNVGSYRVLARVQRPVANTGSVSMKLTWTEGDFLNVTENSTDEVTWGVEESEGLFTLEDLGIVTIEQPPSGTTPRWEGRILAKSTAAADRLYVDCIFLIPVTEGAGEARASTAIPDPTAYVGFEAFEQTAGALAGKTAGIGGVWAGEGDADDFQVVAGTSHNLTRTAVSDAANVPRYAVLGASKYTDILARIDVNNSNPKTDFEDPGRMGLIVRYTNPENWVVLRLARAAFYQFKNLWYLQLVKRVAGVITFLTGSLEKKGGGAIAEALYGELLPWTTLEIMVLANGYWQIGAGPSFAGGASIIASGSDTDMGAAGALKEGKLGIYDLKDTAVAATRYYDNLQAYVPTFDMALYASRQFELRSNMARRQDKEGVTWGKPAYEGDYLLVPQAGPEKRPTRFIVKGSRNPAADAGIDDIRANLFVQPRYLLAPPT